MILNVGRRTATHLLHTVDDAAEELLGLIPDLRDQRLRHDAVMHLKHLGIVKHRLHWLLGLDDFAGPSEWGFPLTYGDRY